MGDQRCQSCHPDEWDAWNGSHHKYAMAEPDEATVRGDFSDVSFNEEGQIYRFYREGERYKVEAPGQDGSRETFDVSYTFGWEPLQQYLIDIGKGKLQALHIAWDTEQSRWFSLTPGEVIPHDDWLHWSRGAMNWNTMCADCHSTNLQKNFVAEADSFHTTWSSINVSCEACHGPGDKHVEFMNQENSNQASTDRIREDLNLTLGSGRLMEVNTCAPCHSLRERLTDTYVHGDDFLQHFDPLRPYPANYFADGQIREEVYVYGSFLQSKMYHEGVTCTDCHNPHTLTLKASVNDNSLCVTCHETGYDTPDHHFHPVNTEGAQCVNCHMTGRYYMEVDFRRDHSFRIPRPDQSMQFGTPNACNSCHTDQTPEWAANRVNEWYGESRPSHFSEILLEADTDRLPDYSGLQELIADTTQPEIIRATAAWYLGRYPDQASQMILEQAMISESSLVRNSAAKALDNFPSEIKKVILEPALADSTRAVRLSAVRGLAEFSETDVSSVLQDYFRQAMVEYETYLDVNQYFPQGQMNRGQFLELQGEIDQAIAAYQRALERDPYFTPAQMNLAYLYNNRGENNRAEELLRDVISREPEFGQAYYSLALLLAEEARLEESIDYFEMATVLLPNQGRIFYNLAVALQTLSRPEEAARIYEQAIQLEPQNGEYIYGIVTLYVQQGENQQALTYARELRTLFPNNVQVQQLVQMIEESGN